jgi:hypothetical protein
MQALRLRTYASSSALLRVLPQMFHSACKKLPHSLISFPHSRSAFLGGMHMSPSQRSHQPDRQRRSGHSHVHYGPLVWIALLLACWFVIAEWQMLPEFINHTMAALP